MRSSRAAAWALATGVGVALGVALVLWIALPRLVGGEAFRESIRNALGYELRYREFRLGYLPPTIVLEDAAFGGDDSEAFARADRAVLRISLVPLLAGAVWVDAATLEGAEVHLVRTPAGVRLSHDPQASPPVHRSASGSQASGRSFAIRHVELPDARLVFEDRTVSPASRIELRDAAVRVRLDRQARFEFAAGVASGGSVRASGTLSAAGGVEATIELERVSIAPAQPYLRSSAGAQGALSGTVDVSDAGIAFALHLDEGRLALGDIRLLGPVQIGGRVEPNGNPPRGRLELDATQAELHYGEFFTKPPGTRGVVSGEVAADAAGTLKIQGWKFEMDDFDGHT